MSEMLAYICISDHPKNPTNKQKDFFDSLSRNL